MPIRPDRCRNQPRAIRQIRFADAVMQTGSARTDSISEIHFIPVFCFPVNVKGRKYHIGIPAGCTAEAGIPGRDVEHMYMNDELTLEQKVALCSGESRWYTKEMPGVPRIMMTDGPHGLRKQENSADMMGINESFPATCFPAAVSTACSWDEELLAKIGRAIALEAAANGVGLLLGPGANIKRNPLCGRNFEYFSEDPYLTGKLAAAYIRGAEAAGISASLKHFALNNQEYKRFSSDSVADERTIREIYLAGFETAVKEGKPSTVMCSYNKINGVHSSDNRWLLTQLLRDEWGFDGMVVTDWGAMNDRIAGFRAGCDLNMPGGSAYMEKEVLQAVKDGKLEKACIDRSAERVKKTALRGKAAVENARAADMDAHYELARHAAEESAVLLKNEGILPLANVQDAVFIGRMAEKLRCQGGGSSHVNPYRLTNVLDACPGIAFAAGCTEKGDTDDQLLSEAVKAAKKAKIAVVFAGLTDSCESEGLDRENMAMPEGHNRMIEAVSAANPNTVVVLLCGSAVELPWAEKVRAILYMGLPGEAGGEAIRNLLFGKANPCGKLAESWPVRYSDCVSSEYYGKRDAHCREGLYVGYRYYTSASIPVRYPFGFGLSYTKFEYSGLKINGNTVTCTVRNAGSTAGKEIVQLYIDPPRGDFYRPARELKGFAKVLLAPGESREVTFLLDDRSFAVWNGGWVIPGGQYKILVGPGSGDLPLSGCVEKGAAVSAAPAVPAWYFKPEGTPSHSDFEALVGHPVTEKPLKKGGFTMENSVTDMKEFSLIMKILYKAMERVIARRFGGKRDYSNPGFRMMMAMAADCSLSCMKINGAMNNHVLEGMLDMANGHFCRGILGMIKG